MRSHLVLIVNLLLVINMKNGQRIHIIPSVALTEMRLEGLIGRSAKVSEILERPDESIKGCWAVLEGSPYEGEQEWYLPFSSFVE